ncbi:MAG: hypothetical protein WC860_08925 [Candidatus Margulisiibacteriota bacterium]|jgi:hypothetical protein
MNITPSLALAQAIVSILEVTCDTSDFVLSSYSNNREQGVHIYNRIPGFDTCVSVSLNRSSDNIVVYTGESNNFQSPGNVPDQSTYINASYFDFKDLYPTAKFIYEFLQKQI